MSVNVEAGQLAMIAASVHPGRERAQRAEISAMTLPQCQRKFAN